MFESLSPSGMAPTTWTPAANQRLLVLGRLVSACLAPDEEALLSVEVPAVLELDDTDGGVMPE